MPGVNMPDTNETVYITIGNNGDELTQRAWSEFCEDVNKLVHEFCDYVVGVWFSAASAPNQNACWAFVRVASVDGKREAREDLLKRSLSILAGKYKQDEIIWSVSQTDYISAQSYPESKEE